MDKSSNISNRLKHRIAQMLLSSSSCTTTSIINISDKTSQEPVFPSSNRRAHHRGKLDHRPHRMAPVVQVSVNCSGRRSVHAPSPNLPLAAGEEEKRNRKEERRVTETGVVNETGVGEGRKCPPASPSSPSNGYYCSRTKEKKAMAERKDKFASEKKKLFSNGYGYSSSSSIGSNDEFFGFSSSTEEEEEEEEEEETGTLFSSKGFSSEDSSEFYRQSSSKETTNNNKSTRRPPGKGGRHGKDSWDEGNNSRPLISVSSREEEKLAGARSGFAVVKRSTDPYGDFRSSMVEMIVEGRMSEPEDLERLLHSYLSLNSPCHHPVILEAFADVWEAIFGEL